MGEWQEATLGDILTLQRGYDLPAQNRQQGPYPIIASTGTVGSHREAMVKAPGLVIGRSGSIGGGQYITKDFWPLNTTLYVRDFKENDIRYCYYLLRTIDFKQFNVGGAVPTLNRNHVHPLPVLKPSIKEQKAIAAVLGALDDKIELNRRMNATLEAMARALFKSWFVDFDPVRAKMEGKQPFGMDAATAALFPSRLVSSPLGDIPEGWEVKTIGDLGKVITGKTPSTADAENFGCEIPFITIPDLNGRMFIETSNRYLSKTGADKVRTSVLPAGAVMMSCIATVGLCGITTQPSVTNQQINSLICNHSVANSSYAYWLFRNITDEVFNSGGGGSVYTNVSKSRFESIKVLIPSIDVQNAFDYQWFGKLRENDRESSVLECMRDYLLPKLISGDIRIPDVEKFLEAA